MNYVTENKYLKEKVLQLEQEKQALKELLSIATEKLGLDCYDSWFQTEDIIEIYNEVLECLKGDEDER